MINLHSCHPQIGAWTKGNLGGKDVHTIDTVLGVMLRKVSSQINTKDRSLLAVRIKRAVLYIHADETIEAHQLLAQVEADIADKVQFWKNKVDQSLHRGQDEGVEAALPLASLSLQSTHHDRALVDSEGLENPKARYRDWVEQHHRILFFMGAQCTEQDMQIQAAEYNLKAEAIQGRMLADPVSKFQRIIGPVMEGMHSVSLNRESLMPQPPNLDVQCAILSKMLHQFKILVQLMNNHLGLLGKWREYLLQSLLQPLDLRPVDGDEELMIPYESEAATHAYLNNYSRLLFFRKDLLSGGQSSIASFVRDAQAMKEHMAMVTGRSSRAATRLKSVEGDETLDEQLKKQMFDLVTPQLAFTFKTVLATLESIVSTANSYSPVDRARAESQRERLKKLQTDHLAIVGFLEK